MAAVGCCYFCCCCCNQCFWQARVSQSWSWSCWSPYWKSGGPSYPDWLNEWSSVNGVLLARSHFSRGVIQFSLCTVSQSFCLILINVPMNMSPREHCAVVVVASEVFSLTHCFLNEGALCLCPFVCLQTNGACDTFIYTFLFSFSFTLTLFTFQFRSLNRVSTIICFCCCCCLCQTNLEKLIGLTFHSLSVCVCFCHTVLIRCWLAKLQLTSVTLFFSGKRARSKLDFGQMCALPEQMTTTMMMMVFGPVWWCTVLTAHGCLQPGRTL